MTHKALACLRRQLPIRLRLTLWYVVLAGLALVAFGLFQYYRMQSSLIASVDRSLEITLTQAMTSIDSENGQPAFQNTDTFGQISSHLGKDDFAVRLVDARGRTLDQLGNASLPVVEGLPVSGFSTVSQGDPRWRIDTQPVAAPGGQPSGWIQSGQSLAPMDRTLADMRTQLLLGLPLILVLIAAGGVLLADRALHPIDQMTQTARALSASDLSKRIDYHGPSDEIGQLAQTIDSMLERLQAAFNRQERFTSDAAHELRTPLTALKGQIEVTLSRPRRGPEYQRALAGLAEQVERLIKLSDALLFLSRADHDRVSMQAAETNLTELLEMVADQFRPLTDSSQLRLTTDLEPAVCCLADRDLLIRVLYNLLDNASKHTPPRGEVSLKLRREGQQALIAVGDNGPGIPAEHLPHLFERFYRVEQDRSSRTGGAGLGLAIVGEIARLHAGQVSVHSQLGAGTTIQVRLPISPD
jgi:heavy metal sensor kinase